jgi:para-nitrobenzyl esterase
MRLTRFALWLTLAILFAGCASPDAADHCASADATVVCTDMGALRGIVDNDMLAFKGIPYGRAPVGPLRWRPTEMPQPWPGIRTADRYGARCPVVDGSEVNGNEDCLYLNIWRPRQRTVAPLPVMVWVTGGGNHALSGEGADSFGGLSYSGAELVPAGVIVVSYNLRLGVLGFLTHPALDAERPEQVSGNYGNLDQIAMLNWLKRNIAAFGGDPDRIFLFGTSAGGGNICALMTSPLTRGLIHGVSMQSSVPMGCEIQAKADAQAGTGRKVVMAVGCNAAADVAACLRDKDVREIVLAVPGTYSVFARVYGPVVDGVIFPIQPLQAIKQGRSPDLPVIIGNTANETFGWGDSAGKITDAASYAAAIDRVFGPHQRERIVAAYPLAHFATARSAFVQLTTDAQFTCQSRRVARAISQAHQQPTFRYFFAHALGNDPVLKQNGAAHTIEHAFLFPGRGGYHPSTDDLALKRKMVAYWTNMARNGDPNGPGQPHWQAQTPGNDNYLYIGAQPDAMRGAPDAQCDLWDGISFQWPHL